jgi:hypothetical protein
MSWLKRASSYGIRFTFLPTSPYPRPLPQHPRVLLRLLATTPAVLFHPRGSSPPRWLPPRAGREFIAPHNRQKVHCVSPLPPPHTVFSHAVCRPQPFPAMLFTPFEEFPHQQPHCVTTAVALLALPPPPAPKCTWCFRSAPQPNHSTSAKKSCHRAGCFPVGSVESMPLSALRCQRPSSAHSQKRSHLQGLAPPVSPYPLATVSSRHEVYPSMGFVPLQGS